MVGGGPPGRKPRHPRGRGGSRPVTAVYDTIGRGYAGQRRADPRVAAAIRAALGDAARTGRGYAGHRRADPRVPAPIRAALGDARSVVNVGAGSGSYEPVDLSVLAVEPSREMIHQRPAGAAPAVQAVAERLPLGDGS